MGEKVLFSKGTRRSLSEKSKGQAEHKVFRVRGLLPGQILKKCSSISKTRFMVTVWAGFGGNMKTSLNRRQNGYYTHS